MTNRKRIKVLIVDPCRLTKHMAAIPASGLRIESLQPFSCQAKIQTKQENSPVNKHHQRSQIYQINQTHTHTHSIRTEPASFQFQTTSNNEELKNPIVHNKNRSSHNGRSERLKISSSPRLDWTADQIRCAR